MRGTRQPGRHAGPRRQRVLFENPGDGSWKTDVLAFVVLPLVLALLVWIAGVAWRAGGADRWNGVIILALTSLFLVPARLRWRRLQTKGRLRTVLWLYVALGCATVIGVIVGGLGATP